VIVAVYNEAESIARVCDELLAALGTLQPFEVVVVDDGSTDATRGLVTALRQKHPCLRLLRHDRRCGKTAALRTGITAARAPWIATMDGDGQNDPADIVPMLQAAWRAQGTPPLIAGIRLRRNDRLSRRIATRFANGFRQAALSDRCPDTACGLKVFRQQDFLRLPMFEGMHRFLPALFQAYGHPLICQPVTHRQRLSGQSKYTNFGRAVVGIRDLIGVMWLRSRTHLPAKVTEI
jgi:dolichol-phosphate mannosyltransferase